MVFECRPRPGCWLGS
ncbi:hypothetical protein MTR67_018860 [Solanum verrucosum]|uniref:Uncharacterized protein n=1 Tax=Solanum verrucosum TaxID=315347 RepID=A0AAF0QN36_SOLVR|nr:hypothetical protein MTR67_018860 [Solanum verrucosum]